MKNEYGFLTKWAVLTFSDILVLHLRYNVENRVGFWFDGWFFFYKQFWTISYLCVTISVYILKGIYQLVKGLPVLSFLSLLAEYSSGADKGREAAPRFRVRNVPLPHGLEEEEHGGEERVSPAELSSLPMVLPARQRALGGSSQSALSSCLSSITNLSIQALITFLECLLYNKFSVFCLHCISILLKDWLNLSASVEAASHKTKKRYITSRELRMLHVAEH